MKHLVPFLRLTLLTSSLLVSSCQQDPTPSGACLLMPEPGPCNAAIPKYYYDQKEKKCKQFTWGGCGGTVPFNTLEECRECVGKK